MSGAGMAEREFSEQFHEQFWLLHWEKLTEKVHSYQDILARNQTFLLTALGAMYFFLLSLLSTYDPEAPLARELLILNVHLPLIIAFFMRQRMAGQYQNLRSASQMLGKLEKEAGLDYAWNARYNSGLRPRGFLIIDYTGTATLVVVIILTLFIDYFLFIEPVFDATN